MAVWELIKSNLTWASAAKFYIWAIGGITAFVLDHQTELPSWVPVLVGALGLVAGWVKSQTPVPRQQLTTPDPNPDW